MLITKQILRPGPDRNEPESGFSRASEIDMQAGVEEHRSGNIFLSSGGARGPCHQRNGRGTGEVEHAGTVEISESETGRSRATKSLPVSMSALGHVTR